ncbi:MAG: hypothetical protein SFW36_15980 [Leptolyngbyaceae cyanobacterium bins.59]|nr:hypothetical protein [Leptolyngbyaceae cyanobacterium bins.59]
MTEPPQTPQTVPLGSEALGYQFVVPSGVRPGAYGAPAQFTAQLKSEDLEMLSQLAEQFLQDPIALQRLNDRVMELWQQDMKRQRERTKGHGRRC